MKRREFTGWEEANKYITSVKYPGRFVLAYDPDNDEIFARVVMNNETLPESYCIIWEGRFLTDEKHKNFLDFVKHNWVEYWAEKIGDDEIVNCWEIE
jgi:hypothetical protein